MRDDTARRALRARNARVRIFGMRVVSGEVVREIGFEVDPQLKALLLEAIAGCDRGEKISADELLRELQRDDSN